MVRINTIGVLAMLVACASSCQASGLDDPKVMEHFGNKKGEVNDAIIAHSKEELKAMENAKNGNVTLGGGLQKAKCAESCGLWWHCQPGFRCGEYAPFCCGEL